MLTRSDEKLPFLQVEGDDVEWDRMKCWCLGASAQATAKLSDTTNLFDESFRGHS